jgi:hypothetical protein
MVDEQGFSGHSRCHRQFIVTGEHIYEARFPHIGAADKSILGLAVLGAFFHVAIAYNKASRFYYRCFFHYFSSLFKREDRKKT